MPIDFVVLDRDGFPAGHVAGPAMAFFGDFVAFFVMVVLEEFAVDFFDDLAIGFVLDFAAFEVEGVRAMFICSGHRDTVMDSDVKAACTVLLLEGLLCLLGSSRDAFVCEMIET